MHPGTGADWTHNGKTDVFVSKLNSSLSTLSASTFLGGSENESAFAISIGTSGKVYVGGYTDSVDFSWTNGAYQVSQNGDNDAFVTKLNDDLGFLYASTFLGGSGRDRAYDLAVDGSGKIYVAGYTSSVNFPATYMSYDSTYNGGTDAFLSKFENLSAAPLSCTVMALWPVDCAKCGYSSILWAQVKNTGTIDLPAGANVWFWVDGPNWSGKHWVGSTLAEDLKVGKALWYSYDYTIPASAITGTYSYRVLLWANGAAISAWSYQQNFEVTCGLGALVNSLWPVSGARKSQVSTLWAQVKNMGTINLPVSAKVWFWVTGPGWSGDHWVGSNSVAGLAMCSQGWYSYDWIVPSLATAGRYAYWAKVWVGSTALSNFKDPENFTI
jgi:hypothetical protein